MTIRTLLNAILNDYENIKIMDYIGELDAIGADLDTDYEEYDTYKKIEEMPEKVLNRKAEYFYIDTNANEVTIFMERQ